MQQEEQKGPTLTSEQVQQQIAQFLMDGGEIIEIPYGLSGVDYSKKYSHKGVEV